MDESKFVQNVWYMKTIDHLRVNVLFFLVWVWPFEWATFFWFICFCGWFFLMLLKSRWTMFSVHTGGVWGACWESKDPARVDHQREQTYPLRAVQTSYRWISEHLLVPSSQLCLYASASLFSCCFDCSSLKVFFFEIIIIIDKGFAVHVYLHISLIRSPARNF